MQAIKTSPRVCDEGFGPQNNKTVALENRHNNSRRRRRYVARIMKSMKKGIIVKQLQIDHWNFF